MKMIGMSVRKTKKPSKTFNQAETNSWRSAALWGINGTARVLIEYTKKVRNQGLLLEPPDIKRDLYGFVYASERNSHGLFDPFPNASAYHQ